MARNPGQERTPTKAHNMIGKFWLKWTPSGLRCIKRNDIIIQSTVTSFFQTYRLEPEILRNAQLHNCKHRQKKKKKDSFCCCLKYVENMRLLHLTDIHASDHSSKTKSLIYTLIALTRPHHIILGGDLGNFHPAFNYFVTLGNHDLDRKRSRKINLGYVDIILLDSGCSIGHFNRFLPLQRKTILFTHVPFKEHSLSNQIVSGSIREPVSYASDMKFTNSSNVVAVFSGHDHNNDHCTRIDNIIFCSTGTVGYEAYGELSRMGRVIDISSNVLTTRLIHDTQNFSNKYTHIW